MSLSLRIQWIGLIAFTWSSLVLRGQLVSMVPPDVYAIQSALSRPFILFYFCWLLWFSFGPGRKSTRPQKWLFADPLVMWLAHVPLLGSIVLTWPYADERSLLLFCVFEMTMIASVAITTVRLPPSEGFGSPLPLVLPTALAIFFLTHPSRYALVLALWMVLLGIAFIYGRTAVEKLLNQSYEANRALAAERDAKSRFLASASHDLAYPLQAARLFFDQTQQQEPGAARDKAVRNVRWAFDTTEHLLNQMIEHLRLESGRVAAQIAPIAIGPPIARTAEMNEPAARLADVAVIALPSTLRVLTDGVMVERILGNFAANAIRHAKAKRVLIGARKHGARVRIWVIDDGTGIPPADIPRLFDDYVQGSDHGDEMRGGFGLGLASARRMADLMGGSVGLDGRWSRGSAFWLELPAA